MKGHCASIFVDKFHKRSALSLSSAYIAVPL